MSSVISHSSAYRFRRFFNWFPLGLTYAFLYMGRYNLTVAKNNLGDLMTKEDFGVIFGVGALTYGVAFLINGPLVDRIGGKKGILISALGSCIMNVAMGLYLYTALTSDSPPTNLRLAFMFLYAGNMYFQSYGAVSIVKVNAHWFHVTERGGFSGIFGTMISSGIFLAFTVNGWLLNPDALQFLPETRQWVVFFAPAGFLLLMFFIESWLLKDTPSQAGFEDFDTADASSGEDASEPIPTFQLIKRIITHPVILTVAFIEFCTGILRNGVMHWFPFYAKEVWALPDSHPLRYGEWSHVWLIGVMFGVAIVSFVLAKRAQTGGRKAWLYIFGALAFLAPFTQGGWGGLQFVAGVIGANVAGWVSDIFFQSRRAPAAGGLYGTLAVCSVLMIFAIKPATTEIDWAAENSGLLAGDRIVSIAGVSELEDWEDVSRAVACVPATCERASHWDAERCLCASAPEGELPENAAVSDGTIEAVVVRGGEEMSIALTDPKPVMSAGDSRRLRAGPVIPISPYMLGGIVFVMLICVIGSHGLLSGTMTMDFGGRRGAATAVGIIDGFVYLGTFVQSFGLGYLTSQDWKYWPLFLLPFGVIGFVLCTRIWHAKPQPRGSGGH